MSRKSDSGLRLSDFDFGDEIGRGGFGAVHKAFWKTKKLEVAIKEISSKTTRDRILSEVACHGDTAHDNIVKFYDSFCEKNVWYLVMELCKEGSLRDYIRRKRRMSESLARSVMRQIIRALEYLHGKGLVHRDLTAGNILISRFRSTGEPIIKLCDFGLSKVMKGRGAHTVVGTPGYMAPNVANREKYGREVDVHSLGCVLYVMLTGKEPESNGQLPGLNQLHSGAADLIERMTDPRQRMSLEDITSSEFMSEPAARSKSRDRRSNDARPSGGNQALLVDENRRRPPLSDRKQVLNEKNVMPPASSRRHSSVSRTQATVTNQSDPWPLRIERLDGKNSKLSNYALFVRGREAVLEKDEQEVLMVRVEGSQQELGIFSCGHASKGRPCFLCTKKYSMDHMPSSTLELYKKVIYLVEEIRWKTAKIIYDRCTLCPEGVVRLMENGDLRIHDLDQDRKYGIKAGTDVVMEGDFRNPTSALTKSSMADEVRTIRTFMVDTEKSLERIKANFPFGGGKSKSHQEHSADCRSRDVSQSNTRTSRQPRMETTSSTRRPSRAHSLQPSRPTQPQVMSHFSAPDPKSFAGQEKHKYDIVRIGKMIMVKDKSNGTSIRESTNTPGQYIIVTGNDMKEKRFTPSKDPQISRELTAMLNKLIDAKKKYADVR